MSKVDAYTVWCMDDESQDSLKTFVSNTESTHKDMPNTTLINALNMNVTQD